MRWHITRQADIRAHGEIGFDTCFTFLARGSYSLAKMNWILVKVFFGSEYLGFVSLRMISKMLVAA